MRRLVNVEAHAVCLSSEGIVMTWNESQHALSTFTLNGVLITRTHLSFSSSISCMEISVDGRSALIGINSVENSKAYNNSWNVKLNEQVFDELDSESEETQEDDRINAPSPSICFLDTHTLKVLD